MRYLNPVDDADRQPSSAVDFRVRTACPAQGAHSKLGGKVRHRLTAALVAVRVPQFQATCAPPENPAKVDFITVARRMVGPAYALVRDDMTFDAQAHLAELVNRPLVALAFANFADDR